MFARKIRQKNPKIVLSFTQRLVQVLAVFTWGFAPPLICGGNSMGAVTEANRSTMDKILCTDMEIYSESGT